MSSTSRNSLEKFSSRRSVRSRPSSSRSITKRRSQEPEVDPYALSREIMNEILDKALEKIHERYMETQVLKFVVHCAHQALIKALSIHFYQHNDYIRSCEIWGSDKRAEPSSPDSWALHQISVSRDISEQEEITTLDQIKKEIEGKGGEVVIDPHLDVISQPSETLIEDLRALLDDIINNLPMESDEMSEKGESVASAFTMVVEGVQHYNDYKMKPQLSRISVDMTTFKLPKIDVPDSGNSRKNQSIVDLSSSDIEKLPPIRTDANSNCRPVSSHDVKKRKKKPSI